MRNSPGSPSLGPNELSVYVTPAAIDFAEGQVPQPFLLYNPFTYPVCFRVQTSNRERYLIVDIFAKPAQAHGMPLPGDTAPYPLSAPYPHVAPGYGQGGQGGEGAASATEAVAEPRKRGALARAMRVVVAPFLLIPLVIGLLALVYIRPAHQHILNVDKGVGAAFLLGTAATMFQMMLLSVYQRAG